jgi:hypothetical protein
MAVTRRRFLQGTAAAGALALARPLGAFADTLGPTPLFDTSRASRLFPGTTLVHCDMHNHTVLSDGDGDPNEAFGSMRAAGLDVAALTDHSTIQWGMPADPCNPNLDGDGDPSNDPHLCAGDVSAIAGITEEKWARLKAIADAANDPGEFLALRGFEWSSPSMGHMNVWFSQKWIDPLHTAGLTTGEGGLGFFMQEGGADGLDQLADALTRGELEEFPMRRGLVRKYNEVMRASKTSGLSMVPFYKWLRSHPATPVIGGGNDGLASFNHPGREPGRFGHFKLAKNNVQQVVAMEIFNRREEYLFEGTDIGNQSPLNECLNKGWRVGLSGVTDEHGTNWGEPDGKGRMGLWIDTPTREGVRQAMLARRFFATRLRGLRVDAMAKGTRMGQTIQHTSGPIEFRLDIDRGTEWYGKQLSVQILRPGSSMPTIAHAEDVTVPTPSEPVIKVWVPNVDIADGDWVVLRVSDRSVPADGRADDTYRPYGDGVAYASPWFLRP